MSGNIFDCQNRGMLLARDADKHSNKQNFGAQNINTAEVNKPWVTGQMQKFFRTLLALGVPFQEAGSMKL